MRLRLPTRLAELSARAVLRYGWRTHNATGGAFIADGLASRHNHDFLADPNFRAAYARGVQAAGWDFNIPWRIHVAVWAASSCQQVAGDFVELGTASGMAASSILAGLPWRTLRKRFWLYDTYLPQEVGADGAQHPTNRYHPYYARSAADTRRNFAEWEGIEIVEGHIPESLDAGPNEVALLLVDLNHAPPEVAGIRSFWPRLTPGGLVLLDDYAFVGHQAQKRAVDELGQELGFDVLTLPTGQGLIKRQ